MEPDILKPKEENLFSLAAEMGLEVFSYDEELEQPVEKKSPKPNTPVGKSYTQLT